MIGDTELLEEVHRFQQEYMVEYNLDVVPMNKHTAKYLCCICDTQYLAKSMEMLAVASAAEDAECLGFSIVQNEKTLIASVVACEDEDPPQRVVEYNNPNTWIKLEMLCSKKGSGVKSVGTMLAIFLLNVLIKKKNTRWRICQWLERM